MAERMKGDVVTILMIIGGIVILLSVLVIGISVYQATRWGPCWANFNQEMGKIEKGVEKLKLQPSTEVTVTMGECVGALVFTNTDDLKNAEKEAGLEFRKELKCPEGRGLIIGLPYDQETKTGWRIWRLPKDILENFVRWWKGKALNINPLCRSADREIETSNPVIWGPGEGKTRILCLKIIKTATDKYGVSYGEGACA